MSYKNQLPPQFKRWSDFWIEVVRPMVESGEINEKTHTGVGFQAMTNSTGSKKGGVLSEKYDVNLDFLKARVFDEMRGMSGDATREDADRAECQVSGFLGAYAPGMKRNYGPMIQDAFNILSIVSKP